MKKISILILSILTLGQAFGQADKNNNPVFNSVSTNERPIEDLLLISNYYTLKNNIENKQSSVFISENPTLDQIEKAATNLPSDFFILTKESKMVVMVMLQNNPKREFMTIVMSSNDQSTYPCALTGDITENRAVEILKERFDTSAIIEDGTLKFNGKSFKIISNQQIEESIFFLIKKEKLDKKKPSHITLLSKKEMKSLVLSETKDGGKLDFFTAIKGQEMDGIQIKKGVFATKISVALYKWGRACYEIGVNTVDDSYEIFSEYKSRQLNQREKEYIKMGFNKDLEE